MECKTPSQNPKTSINHILFALILLHCLNWGYRNRPRHWVMSGSIWLQWPFPSSERERCLKKESCISGSQSSTCLSRSSFHTSGFQWTCWLKHPLSDWRLVLAPAGLQSWQVDRPVPSPHCELPKGEMGERGSEGGRWYYKGGWENTDVNTPSILQPPSTFYLVASVFRNYLDGHLLSCFLVLIRRVMKRNSGQ